MMGFIWTAKAKCLKYVMLWVSLFIITFKTTEMQDSYIQFVIIVIVKNIVRKRLIAADFVIKISFKFVRTTKKGVLISVRFAPSGIDLAFFFY